MLIPLPLLGFLSPGPLEMIIFGVVAVLLFGSRLPSVARSAGKSLMEFKKGMQDLQEDVRDSIEIKEPAGTTSQTSSTPTTTTQASTERSPTEGDGDTYDSYPKPESPQFESSPVEVPAADKPST